MVKWASGLLLHTELRPVSAVPAVRRFTIVQQSCFTTKTMKTRFSALRRHARLLCLSLALFAFAGLTRADDVPTFSDPDVTAYVKSYGEFADQYAANMKNYMAATKSGDTTKMQAAAQKMQADQAKSQEMLSKSATVSGKVKPDETQKFTGYLQKCAQKMADASK